jgi:hypothetical protein
MTASTRDVPRKLDVLCDCCEVDLAVVAERRHNGDDDGRP